MFGLFPKNKKGIIFLTALILAFLMVVAAGALSRMVTQDLFMIRHLRLSTQSSYLAEVGINEAIYFLDKDFNNLYSFPLERNLGSDGKFRVDYGISGDRILLTSAGTVAAVTRTVAVEIKNPLPEVFNYVLATGGNTNIRTFGSDINITGNLNSNRRIALGASASGSSIDINGDVNAGSTIRIKSGLFWLGPVNISGSQNEGVDKLRFPRFNRGFYRSRVESAYYYNGNTTFRDENLSPPNGIVFVDGNVTFRGDNTLNGVLCARRDIKIIGKLTQTPHADHPDYPALISGDDIKILRMWLGWSEGFSEGSLNSQGLIYARDKIDFAYPGNCSINGLIIAGGKFTIKDLVGSLNFTFAASPAPPGLILPGGETQKVEIISWNR